ncbi:MAG TPA: pitrilysin family protein [Blastocatellia bacterium]
MAVGKRAALVGLLLVATVGVGVRASTFQATKANPQSSPFVLPIVKRDSLLNGLQLITLEHQGTGAVSTHLRINSGALFDLAGKGGLADVTAGMLLTGAGGLNAKDFAKNVEQLALRVNVTTGWDSTDIQVTGSADSLESIFDLFGKILITPTFDEKELSALKTARAATLSKDAQEDPIIVERKALEALFGSYPFGRPARGTAESVGRIARQDLVYYHNRFYIANNSELLVSGDATAEQVTRLARAKLGAWKKGEKVLPTFRPPESQSARRVFIIDRTEDRDVVAAVAQIGVSRRADDYLAAMVMFILLRREISKLTDAHPNTLLDSEFEPRLLAGPLILFVKSPPSDLADRLDTILNMMAQMQSAAPSTDRVEAVKAELIASMAERLKSPEGAPDVILDIETYGLGRDYLVNYAGRLNAMTPADVQRAAQTYLKPQLVTIVIAGPASRFENVMKKVGTVAVLK